MNDKERMLQGKLYNPYRIDNHNWLLGKKVLTQFNRIEANELDKGIEILKTVMRNIGENTLIVPPLYYDHADKTSIGYHCFINTDFMTIGDESITIGNHVYIGPRVSIYTAAHPIDALVRNKDLEIALPVTIKDNVWIGGNVVINPGVTIGNNVVIGSGSVVTKDIEDKVVAAGNPCKAIRTINEQDKVYWLKEYEEYINN